MSEEKKQLVVQINNISQEKQSATSKSKELNERLEAEKAHREDANQRIKELENKLSETTLWSIFCVLLVLTTFVVWEYQLFWNFAWLISHKNRIWITVVGQVLTIFALLNIPLGRFWKVWLPIIITLFLALIALLTT